MAKQSAGSRQNCLFCLHPTESNCKDTQDGSTVVYRDVFECSKDLLKDKINYSEWIYSEDNLSPLCRQCFKSSEEMYEVSKKLMELKKTLDELVEKLTLEINDRLSKMNENEELGIIKVEKDEVVEDDVYAIDDEDDYCQQKSESSTSIGYLDSDVDEKEDPLNLDCINEIVDDESVGLDEGSVELPEVYLHSTENLLETDKLKNCKSSQNGKLASIQLPRVVLHRLDLEKYNPAITQYQGKSALGKRKAAVTAVDNIRKYTNVKIASSKQLSADYTPSTDVRNISSGQPSGIVIGNPINVIAVPLMGQELTNLVCSICQENFMDLQSLLNHKQGGVCKGSVSTPSKKEISSVKRVRKVKSLKAKLKIHCDVCGKPLIRRKSVLDRHRLTHNGEHEKPFKCSSCEKGFNQKFILEEHFLTYHSEEFPNECKVCGKKWKTKTKLLSHMKSHSSKGRYSCPICKASFKSSYKMEAHKNGHERKIYTCSFCSKNYPSEMSLKTHKRIYHGRRQDYVCDHEDCSKTFKFRSQLVLHCARTHGEEIQGQFECPKCPKRLNSSAGLRCHMKLHGEKQFQCTACGKTYASAHSLKKHSLVHQEGEFVCSICGKIMSTQIKLWSHKTRMHRLANYHTCEICGYQCQTKSRLKTHTDTVHKKICRYQCDICGMSFTLGANLRRHERVHKAPLERQKFRCEICGDKSFTVSGGLKFHQTLYHSAYTEEISHCDKCGNKFSNGLELYRHNRVRSTNPSITAKSQIPYKCPICEATFQIRCEMFLHYSNVHPTVNLPYKCETCHIVFLSPTILKHHVTSNCGNDDNLPKNNYPYKCPFCEKPYFDKRNLESHMKIHHKNEQNFAEMLSFATSVLNQPKIVRNKSKDNKHQCHICGKEYRKPEDLNGHINTHTGVKPYVCETCGISYSSKSSLRSHEKLHWENKPSCNTCGKQFAGDRELQRHQQLVHLNGEILTCPTCEKTFVGKFELQRHQQSEHLKAERLTCPTCGKTFAQSISLKQHENSIHSNERPFVCSTCGKTFAIRSLLKSHERIVHSKERPFICATCGKTFSIPINLEMHERIHTGQKEFSCSFCGKAFTMKTNMKRHERTHTGEKPYQCKYCPKAFAHPTVLQTHLRIHTGEKPYSCSICGKMFSDSATFSKHKKVHNK